MWRRKRQASFGTSRPRRLNGFGKWSMGVLMIRTYLTSSSINIYPYTAAPVLLVMALTKDKNVVTITNHPEYSSREFSTNILNSMDILRLLLQIQTYVYTYMR